MGACTANDHCQSAIGLQMQQGVRRERLPGEVQRSARLVVVFSHVRLFLAAKTLECLHLHTDVMLHEIARRMMSKPGQPPHIVSACRLLETRALGGL